MMRIEPLGDQALLLTLGDTIAPAINERVCAYQKVIREQLDHIVTFIVPAYNTLAVGFDPLVTKRSDLIRWIEELEVADIITEGRLLYIPVCYDEKFGMDLDFVSKATGLDQRTIIEDHSEQVFLVYMLGFVPGFVYMGSLPEAMQLARRERPRQVVPPGSVALAGEQTGIYPSAVPGGWHIIGRTPISLLSKEDHHPSPFRVGDRVQFQPIDAGRFDSLKEQVLAGTFDIKDLLVGQ